MRSYPVFRLLVVLFALAVAGIAVRNVTQADAGTAAAEPTDSVPATNPVEDELSKAPEVPKGMRRVKLDLTLSHAAEEMKLTALGRDLMGPGFLGATKIHDGHGATIYWNRSFSEVTLPKEAVDVVVKVRFKDKANNSWRALRVRCIDPDNGAVLADATLWGQDEIEDVVTVRGADKSK
jgi:hypothetical protein